MSLVRSEAMFLRNTSQPASTWLDRTHLCLSIDRNEAHIQAITRNPLEAVESRPVGVAAHVDPITQTGSDAAQRSLDIGNPPRVVNDGDAVSFTKTGRPVIALVCRIVASSASGQNS